jgi:flagellar protein FliS
MDGISAYKHNAISTQSRGRLIVLLYEGAVKFLKQAIAEIEAGRWTEKGQYINKALAIISELDACLDIEAGGEVAMNLRKLYQFMYRHLAEANLERDPERIREVIAVLDELNEGWRAVTA